MRSQVDQQMFRQVLQETVQALDGEGIPFLLQGGIASRHFGRNRWTRDIDVFVKDPDDARRALAVLGRTGFETEETDASWLFKAFRNGVEIDVIFRSSGDVYLDDEMLARAVATDFEGVPIRMIPAEDLLVIKANAHSERAARHWHDGLHVIARGELDWDYVVQRAKARPGRVLSLLIYAQSDYLPVPDHVVHALLKALEEQRTEQIANQHVIAQLRQALAEDNELGELNVHISMPSNREVLLTGSVTTEQRRQAVAGVAERLVPEYRVINRVEVLEIHQEREAERIRH